MSKSSFFNNFSSYEGFIPAGLKLPEIDISKEEYRRIGLKSSASNSDYLRALCDAGMKSRGILKKKNVEEYKDRLNEEMSTLDELGFVDYMLLNYDVVKFAKDSGIPKGPARGSAGGCLVLFLIGVTDLDPVEGDLFFERFVSKSRARKIESNGEIFLDGTRAPDVDLDFSQERRHEIVEYVEKKYPNRTCHILTLNTFSSKLVVRECGKIVCGLSEERINEISDVIPKRFGNVAEIDDACEQSEDFSKYMDEYPELKRIAKKIHGLNKNTGCHPSGIAISNLPLNDYFPLQRTKDGALISGQDMHWVAELMLKLDLLGLRTLSVLNKVENLCGVKCEDIDYNSFSDVYQYLDDLKNPHGLFQIETQATYRVCKRIKPKNLEQLSALTAISRPGAIDFLDQYCRFLETGECESVHSHLDDVFKITGGIPLYQESLMRAAQKVGFNGTESDDLRRIVGKKDTEKVKEWKGKIDQKIIENNLDPALSNILWKICEAGSNYSFNASHARAYSIITAWTTYYKFNYTKEFYTALLEMSLKEQNPREEISKISNELISFGIRLLPPDLAKSKMEFSIDGENIRFGLSAIKGVAQKTLQSIIDFRDTDKPTKYDIFLVAKQAGLNIGTLSALIQAGALPGHKKSRSSLVLEAQTFNILTEREKRNMVALGEKFDYDVLKTIKTAADEQILGDDGKVLIKPSRFETIKKKYEPYKQIWQKNSKTEIFANWYYENELLGYSYSCDLKDVMGEAAKFSDSEQIKKMKQWQKCRFVGRVEDDPRKAVAASGNSYIKIDARDAKGGIAVMLMNNKKRNYLDEYLESGNNVPEKGNIITVFGSKGEDIIFAEEMSILSNKIYMKLKDLKEEADIISV